MKSLDGRKPIRKVVGAGYMVVTGYRDYRVNTWRRVKPRDASYTRRKIIFDKWSQRIRGVFD